MFCKYCGSEVNDDSQFCSTCGSKIENNQPKSQVEQLNNQPENTGFGLNLAATILGGIGIINVVNFVSFILAVVGLILGAVGLPKAIKTHKETGKKTSLILSIVGLSLSGLALLLCVYSVIMKVFINQFFSLFW